MNSSKKLQPADPHLKKYDCHQQTRDHHKKWMWASGAGMLTWHDDVACDHIEISTSPISQTPAAGIPSLSRTFLEPSQMAAEGSKKEEWGAKAGSIFNTSCESRYTWTHVVINVCVLLCVYTRVHLRMCIYIHARQNVVRALCHNGSGAIGSGGKTRVVMHTGRNGRNNFAKKST